MLVWIDSVVSTLIRWGMISFVYILSLFIVLMEILANICLVFDEEYTFGAIDTLEFFGLVAFVLVSIRFWNKGFVSGLTRIQRIYEYFKIVTFLFLIESLIFTFAVIFLIIENGSVSESDLTMSMSEDLPAFWLLSLVLYAFAPTGKVKKKISISSYDTDKFKIDETNSKAEVL
ncbi:MAG: hypothetical protein VB958_02635 [Thalassolituus sp.]|uniref:hypothetical protein n=1 Tax=Thalassolituus sp. TaxID=2030822 RepID=UPI003982954B